MGWCWVSVVNISMLRNISVGVLMVSSHVSALLRTGPVDDAGLGKPRFVPEVTVDFNVSRKVEEIGGKGVRARS